MEHHNDTIFDAIILILIGISGWVIVNLHDILGDAFLILSIAFLVWKWRKEAKKKDK